MLWGLLAFWLVNHTSKQHFCAVDSELLQCPAFSTWLVHPSRHYHSVSPLSCSNPEVQLQVLAYGSMPLLVHLLSPNKLDLLQRRATFAISALMRGQSEAVLLFLKENGIEKLSEEMDNRSPALLSKGITLISDILNTEVTL